MFIELTQESSESILVNTDHIISISPLKNGSIVYLSRYYTSSTVLQNGVKTDLHSYYVEAKESYDHIKNVILRGQTL